MAVVAEVVQVLRVLVLLVALEQGVVLVYQIQLLGLQLVNQLQARIILLAVELPPEAFYIPA
jgi:hypothetical protein